jgi:hypothetical protein
MSTASTENHNNTANSSPKLRIIEVEDQDAVETENEGECVLKGTHLSILAQNLNCLPQIVLEESEVSVGNKKHFYSPTKVHQLDLSYNSFKTLDNLDKFPNLVSLVVDNNQLESFQNFPQNESMQTLWVNNNNISELKVFLDSVSKAFPNLTYLSMLKNPACPNYFTGKDHDDYKRYRFYVLYRLKKLKFLDSSPVNDKERKEANRVGPYMITVKPDEAQYKQQVVKTEQQNAETLPMLPGDLQPEGKGSARFGISSYVYYGKHSEGNRFIMNDDL